MEHIQVDPQFVETIESSLGDSHFDIVLTIVCPRSYGTAMGERALSMLTAAGDGARSASGSGPTPAYILEPQGTWRKLPCVKSSTTASM